MCEKEEYTIEHVFACSRGGTSHLYNLALACKRCNNKRGSKSPVDFFKANCKQKGELLDWQDLEEILNDMSQKGNKKEVLFAQRQNKQLKNFVLQCQKWGIF